MWQCGTLAECRRAACLTADKATGNFLRSRSAALLGKPTNLVQGGHLVWHSNGERDAGRVEQCRFRTARPGPQVE